MIKVVGIFLRCKYSMFYSYCRAVYSKCVWVAFCVSRKKKKKQENKTFGLDAYNLCIRKNVSICSVACFHIIICKTTTRLVLLLFEKPMISPIPNETMIFHLNNCVHFALWSFQFLLRRPVFFLLRMQCKSSRSYDLLPRKWSTTWWHAHTHTNNMSTKYRVNCPFYLMRYFYDRKWGALTWSKKKFNNQ